MDRAFEVTPSALRGLAQHVDALPPENLRALLRHSVRWCADLEAVEALVGACERAADFPAPLQPLLPGARRRLAFRKDVASRGLDKIPVVSLGGHCLAFDLPMRFGFGVRFDGRTLFSPFSLAVHKLDFVLKTLEADWDGYIDDKQLMLLRSANGLLCVARRDGAAVWNHHIGEPWAAEDFAPFKASIAAARAKVEELLRRDDVPLAVFILAFTPAFNPDLHGRYLERALKIVEARSGGLKPHILGVSTPREPGAHSYETSGPLRLSDRITAVEMTIPYPNYVWHDDIHNNSPDGVAFDFRVAEALATELQRWRDRAAPARAPGREA